MKSEDIDRILSQRETLEPSSGLALKIIETIHCHATGPAPRRFPWLQFLIGIFASTLTAFFAAEVIARLVPVLSTFCSPFESLMGSAPRLAYALIATVGGVGLSVVPRYLAKLRVSYR